MGRTRRDKAHPPTNHENKLKMKKPSGLTIIEAVVAMSILAIASIVIVSLYIAQTRLYRSESAVTEIKLQKTIVLKAIKDTGEAAGAVAASYTFGGIARNSSSSTIIFRLFSIAADKSIISAKYDYVAFYREGSGIYAEIAADAASSRKTSKRLLSANAADLIFRYNNNLPQNASVVSYYIRLQNNAITEEGGTSVQLRNKQL